ncbi:MAG: MerR family transcriptional regulator [Eubacteriales bacterium]
MEQYISVGEVCKLTGLSVGSLRYYEKLGILKPAHINVNTNYRYYTHRQLFLLDFISICVDMDIPLKEFKEHFDENGSLNLETILNKGIEIAKLKQEKVQHQLNLMESMAIHLQETENIIQTNDVYEKTLKKRHFINIDFPFDCFRLADFEKLRSELIQKQEILFSASTSVEEGILFRKVGQKGKEIKAYLILEVGKSVKNETISVPSGVFSSFVTNRFTENFQEIKDCTTSFTVCRFINQKIYSDTDMNMEIQREIID